MIATILFGVDDTCPFNQGGLELGGDLTDGAIARLLDFVQDYPKVKVTHFVPANYQRAPSSLPLRAVRKVLQATGKHKQAKNLIAPQTDDVWLLQNHPEWCSFMRRQAEKGRFSLELHGWRHFNPARANAEEFLGLHNEEAGQVIDQAMEQFERVLFEEPLLLSPPGWAVTDELLIELKRRALAIAGSMHHAGEPYTHSDGAGIKGVHPIKPSLVNGVLNVPRNWDLKDGTLHRARAILDKGGLLSVHAHVANIGVENGLTKENLANLANLLDYLEKERIDYLFRHFRSVLEHGVF